MINLTKYNLKGMYDYFTVLIMFLLFYSFMSCDNRGEKIIISGVNNLSDKIYIIELNYFIPCDGLNYTTYSVDEKNRFFVDFNSNHSGLYLLVPKAEELGKLLKYHVFNLYNSWYNTDLCINIKRGIGTVLYLSPGDEVNVNLGLSINEVNYLKDKHPLYSSFPYFLKKNKFFNKLTDPISKIDLKKMNAAVAYSTMDCHISDLLDSIEFFRQKDIKFYEFLRSEIVYSSKSHLMQYYHIMKYDSVAGYYSGYWEFDQYEKIFDFDTINSTVSRELCQFLELRVNFLMSKKKKIYSKFYPFNLEKYQIAKDSLVYPYNILYLESRINRLNNKSIKNDFFNLLKYEVWK